MAHRGFRIRDMLDEIGVKLNMPPFLDGPAQLLPAKEIQGRLPHYGYTWNALLAG